MLHDQLLKYVKGETSEAESIEVFRWINSNEQNRKDYESLRRVCDAMLCSDDVEIAETSHSHHPLWHRIASAVAIAIVAMAAGYWGANMFNHSASDEIYALNPQSIYVPVGQRAEITLHDGTHVWLNSNSRLDVGSGSASGIRYVRLNGEAYFDVARDENHPFIVSTAQHEIRVLGTSFDVCSYGAGDNFSLRLLSGEVNVTDTNTGNSVMMTKGNMITNSLITLPMTKSDSMVWWVRGIYQYDNSEYGEIFHQLQERYHVTINVKNPDILKYRCTCKFSMEDGLIHIVRGMQHIHTFEYEYDEPNRMLTVF